MKLPIIVVLLLLLALLFWKKGKQQNATVPIASTSSQVQNVQSLEIDKLLAKYSLVDGESAFFGNWKQGQLENTRIAFQSSEKQLNIYVGDFDADQEQLTDLYLAKLSATNPLPNKDAQKLDRFLPAEEKELALKYYLLASGPDKYPQLQSPTVCEGLLGLSTAVVEVGFFESGGIQLLLSSEMLTSATLDSDLRLSVEMYKALI
jgi:hypothetical protein